MKKSFSIFILVLALFAILFSAFAQESVENPQQNSLLVNLILTFGPIALFIFFLVKYLGKSQKSQNRYFGNTLPEYTKKHMEHMDQLIERLDKLISILEKK